MKNVLVLLLISFSLAGFCQTGDIESRIKKLEEVLSRQSQTISQQQQTIEELKAELQALKDQNTGQENASVQAKETAPAELKSSGLFGSSSLMNPNISVVLNTYAYSSNLKKEELASRSIKGFTTQPGEMEKGFNLEAAELYIYAPVDPYFNLYTTIPVTEDGAEVEEAYFVTTALPYGLQVKGGKFKSSFGRLNSQHSHAWDFTDAPLAYRAFIGGEGYADKGVSVNYLPPAPFYLSLGAEIFQGDNELLFGEEAKNGPHACSLYAKTSFDFGRHSSVLTGVSMLRGYTLTDTAAENSIFKGKSSLYDFEFTYKWKKSKFTGFMIQSEYLYRTQHGDLYQENTTADYLKRNQDGFYVQAVYLFGDGRWRVGTRYDRLNLFKDDYKLGSENLCFGKNPYRVSAMAEYNPTEFSRIRLQYNHDRSDSAGRTNREFVLQFIFGIGAHDAHAY
jgi:hypothetical protein